MDCKRLCRYNNSITTQTMGINAIKGGQSIMVTVESLVYGAQRSNTTLDESSVARYLHFGIPTSLSTSKAPEWLHSVENEILDLLNLAEGWDGELAYPISPVAANKALKLAHQIKRSHPILPHPTVIPTVDGGVALEWYTKTHYIDFTVEAEAIYISYGDRIADIEWEGPLHAAPIPPEDFLRRHCW